MSEQKFKEAKSQLAFSQQLVDKLRQPQMAPQEPTSPQDTSVPQKATIQPQPPQVDKPQETTGIIDAVKRAIQPMIDEVKKLFTETKQVELKIDGEMKPKP